MIYGNEISITSSLLVSISAHFTAGYAELRSCGCQTASQAVDLGGSIQEGLLRSFTRHKPVRETELSSVLHLLCAYLKKCSASSLQMFVQWSGGVFTADLIVVASLWSGMLALSLNF